jgi:hypothetical protein
VRIQRRENDPTYAPSNEIFYDLDLLVSIVFAQWALPDNLNCEPFLLEFSLGFKRAGAQ